MIAQSAAAWNEVIHQQLVVDTNQGSFTQFILISILRRCNSGAIKKKSAQLHESREAETWVYTEDAAEEGECQKANSVGLLSPTPLALGGSLQHALALKY